MKAGVLIVGSLLWDKDQGSYTNLRADWRKKRLLQEKKIHVFAPIRYGRVSDDGVHTMVFSKEAEKPDKLGTAYVFPCKKEIKSFKGLNQEAEALSNAEGGNDTNFVKGGRVKWCVIGILFNPSFEKAKRKRLVKDFQKILNEQGLANEFTKFKIARENSILTSTGEIDISWPKTVNPNDQQELNGFDFILATCPQQNISAYPEFKAIKTGALKHARKYFFNNIANGITTFQDQEILDAIKSDK